MVADSSNSISAIIGCIIVAGRLCNCSPICIYAILMKEKHSDFESIIGIMLLCAVGYIFTDKKLFIYLLIGLGILGSSSKMLRMSMSNIWLKIWMSVGKVVSVIPLGLIFTYLSIVRIFNRRTNSKSIDKTTNFKDSITSFDRNYFDKTW